MKKVHFNSFHINKHMNQKTLKLSNWAKAHDLTYRGAYNAFVRGDIEGAFQLPTGTIMVPVQEEPKQDYTAIYGRVSTHKQKNDLDSQISRIKSFCIAKGWEIRESHAEVASGMNDNRPKLNKLLSNPQVTRIVVEHKDRLTRFGFNFIKNFSGKEIVVINETEDETDDLMQDFVSVITSMVARLYGKRRSKRKTEELINKLSND